jgi:hypothetical protein
MDSETLYKMYIKTENIYLQINGTRVNSNQKGWKKSSTGEKIALK